MINTAYTNTTVDHYTENVDTMPKSEVDEMLREAEQYNAKLSDVAGTNDLSDFDPSENYNDILNVTEEGVMGSVEIPAINVRLPIYHGTEEEFLDNGAGHLMGSSFPIGGDSTHAVISAHTAYPGKQFFDKLTDLKEGDVFYTSVLNRTLEYRVTDIQVVLPSECQSLNIVKGMDLVTLVTCTPYSINTHRLLVTGERVNEKDTSLQGETDNAAAERQTNRTYHNKTIYYLIGFVTLSFSAALLIDMAMKRKKHRNNEKENL